MVLAVFLALVPPLVAGFCIVSLLWPQTDRVLRTLPLRVCLGAGVGMGVVSALYVLWLALIGPNRSFFIFEAALLAGLAFTAARRRRPPVPSEPPVVGPRRDRANIPSLLLVAALIVSLTATVDYAVLTVKRPHGSWDAWAIWNLRAKFLFQRGGDLPAVFSPVLAHPGYPLLLPGMVARSWWAVGAATPAVPITVAALFTVATVGLLSTALITLRGPTAALLGTSLLLGTPAFLQHGANQLADIPLGFFILATLVLLQLAAAGGDRRYRFLMLAGVTAGLAAWTKNEGILFAAALIVGHAAVTVAASGWAASRRQIGAFAVGVAPFVALVSYVKLAWAPGNDIFSSLTLPAILDHLLNPARTALILSTLAQTLFSVDWRIPSGAVLLSLLVIGGEHGDEQITRRRGLSVTWVVLLLMFAAYFFIYQITPQDLSWHLKTSLDRLLLHLWPGLLFSLMFARQGIRSLIQYLSE